MADPIVTISVVPCPRCHQSCGWCSDYRFMHGKLKMPGSKRRCTVPGIEPEGKGCPICGGEMNVRATITRVYERITPPAENGAGEVAGSEAERSTGIPNNPPVDLP